MDKIERSKYNKEVTDNIDKLKENADAKMRDDEAEDQMARDMGYKIMDLYMEQSRYMDLMRNRYNEVEANTEFMDVVVPCGFKVKGISFVPSHIEFYFWFLEMIESKAIDLEKIMDRKRNDK